MAIGAEMKITLGTMNLLLYILLIIVTPMLSAFTFNTSYKQDRDAIIAISYQVLIPLTLNRKFPPSPNENSSNLPTHFRLERKYTHVRESI